ncbi:predicted protein [Nematostella vectensis]|uniref:SEA domain-containing protein n=1 Tax=Nematostella vectensis TaxID=45351 RepID=A7SI68_NEMVE|nr:predicted protein [Nematostella vectensis]|eukprot:XP_001628645.1 predicted protein [Nematostella vectensis]
MNSFILSSTLLMFFVAFQATSSQTSSSIEASSTSTAAVTSSSSASIESPSTSASLTTTSSSAFSTSSASTTPTASLSQTPTTTSSVGSVGSVSSSISPSTTTTTSTSTASSSPKRGANGELQCQVNMNANFTNDMTNKSSAAYRNTCESVLNAIKTAINAKVGSVTMKSCNLTRGSVIANVDSALEDIKFTSDGSDPLVAIQNAVQAITSVGGFSANVSGVEIKFGSDTTVTAFNITKTDFKTDCCKSDFQYTNLTRECYVTKDGQKSPCSNFQTYKTVPCDMKKTHDAYKIGEPVPSDFFDQLCISGSLCVQASMLTLALGFFISKKIQINRKCLHSTNTDQSFASCKNLWATVLERDLRTSPLPKMSGHRRILVNSGKYQLASMPITRFFGVNKS